MKKGSKISNLLTTAEQFTSKNSPAILTGLAIVGLVGTAVAAWKAAPKAERIIKAKKADMADVHPGDKETKRAVMKEAVKELAPVVAPVVVMGGATAACILGSNKVSSKRIAVLSAAYSISEKAVTDLNEKMQATLGDKKTQVIKEAVAKDRLKDVSVPKEEEIIITGNGKVKCCDLYNGRYFYSNAQKVGQAINELSANCASEMEVTLNEFYDLLEIPRKPIGDDLGWTVDDLNKGILPITYTAILNEEGEPCLAIDYDARMVRDFRTRY
jgi:hypothetical protein